MVKNQPPSPPLRILLADIILAVFLLALAVLGFLSARQQSQPGRFYIIELEGEVKYRLPLQGDTLLSIPGRTGEVSITVHNGEIAVSHTTCPLKICQRTGCIHRPGEAIICVPNRLVITVEGGKHGDIDAITE